MDERGRRVGQNEIVFREVNERLRELGESFSVVSEVATFVCECADTSCTERLQLSLGDYERIRSDPKWFVIVVGHEEPDYERVIERRDDYAIVEKLPGGPAGMSIKEDPRADQH